MEIPVLNGQSITVTEDGVDETIKQKIKQFQNEGQDDPFYVVDVNELVARYRRWQELLPRVEVFYAVKCNHDPVVMATLAKLGAGFDCASKGEIERALAVDTPVEKIVYANPIKQISHVRLAKANNVEMMTFDSEFELQKMKEHYPGAKLLIRIKPRSEPPVPGRLSIGLKFGIRMANVRRLLTVAKDLGLDVVGVCFHVGTAEYPPSVFVDCVRDAKAVFDLAQHLDFQFRVLDLGGGFTSLPDAKYSFDTLCAALRPALDELFPADTGIRLLAEPGRYMVARAFTLAVGVIAKRLLYDNEIPSVDGVPDPDYPRHMYYLGSGVFHSFLCRTKCPTAEIRDIDLHDAKRFADAPRHKTILWGPTMAPGDAVIKGDRSLPELSVGDWLVFRDMGDYSICQFSHFGSLAFPDHVYIVREDTWEYINMKRT